MADPAFSISRGMKTVSRCMLSESVISKTLSIWSGCNGLKVFVALLWGVIIGL